MTKIKKCKSSIGNMFSAILLVMTGGYLVALYAPLELYAANITDFPYDVWDLMRMMLPVFLALGLVGIAVLFLLHKLSDKLLLMALVMGTVLLLAMWIQGTFLSSGLPLLNGALVDWGQYPYQRFFSIVIWMLSFCGGLFILIRMNEAQKIQIINYICGCIFSILVLTTGVMCLSGNTLEEKDDLLPTSDYIFDYSSEKNFLVLLLDTVPAEAVEQALAARPALNDILEDFVFFKNTTGVYSATAETIPFIFSGEWFENKETYYAYRQHAYQNAVLFDLLGEQNYRIGMYEDDLPEQKECVSRFENTTVIESNQFRLPLEFIKTQLKLAGLRYLPFDLKRYCLMDSDIMYGNFRKSFGQEELFTWDNRPFFEMLKNRDVVIGSQNVFRFYHLKGAHVPYRYDSEMNVLSEDTSFEECVLGSFQVVERFLDKLKENDVYDNSIIIIMADHGAEKKNYQNPMLMIKGIGEKHPFRRSFAPISYADLMSAYSRLMCGSLAEQAFDAQEGDIRERRYITWERSEDHMIEYIQYGDAWNTDTLVPTGNEYIQ